MIVTTRSQKKKKKKNTILLERRIPEPTLIPLGLSCTTILGDNRGLFSVFCSKYVQLTDGCKKKGEGRLNREWNPELLYTHCTEMHSMYARTHAHTHTPHTPARFSQLGKIPYAILPFSNLFHLPPLPTFPSYSLLNRHLHTFPLR